MSITNETRDNTETNITDVHGNNETTPLISATEPSTALVAAGNAVAYSTFMVVKTEFQTMVSSSALIIVAITLQYSFMFTNVMSVGHLGAEQLAAMSLALTCAVVFASAPVYGLVSAMDTFCSTAYTASRDKTLVGFHYQRGIIAVVTHVIIIAPFLWNAERILLAINQSPKIAHLSGMYLRIHIIGTLPSSLTEASKRFLQAQGIMRAGTIIIMVVAPIHWFNNFFLVRSPKYGLGFIGAPIVYASSNWLMFLGFIIFIYNSRAREAWGGWTLKALHNMSAYYRLAIPAIITICSEWVAAEILSIGVSYFGAIQLASHAIVLNTVILLSQASQGLGYATSPRIGNLMGAAKPRQARIAAYIMIAMSVVISTIGILVLTIFRNWWIAVYTSDADVARETAKLLSIACVFLVGDGLNAVFSAILRGLGRQGISAKIYLFGFYACAIPVGFYLGYGRQMRAAGLWWGLCTGVYMCCFLQVIYFTLFIDWNDEVRLCIERLRNNERSIGVSND